MPGATAPDPVPTNCSARVTRRARPVEPLHTDRTGPAARSARRVALDALRRIEVDGAYANLVLGPMLATSGLTDMDRRFVTELVYGTTRMRRACDSVIDRFVTSPPDDATRSVLRLGAYQLVFAGVPPHAAVGETVGLAPKRTRGFVNAVLRKVSRLSVDEMSWPSDGARLSYPDWMVELFRAELGADDAVVRWSG
jgi:16S rRNA (cytosine967-C5)-methyltransferase